MSGWEDEYALTDGPELFGQETDVSPQINNCYPSNSHTVNFKDSQNGDDRHEAAKAR